MIALQFSTQTGFQTPMSESSAKNMLTSPAIRWDGDTLFLLDQRKLPTEEHWLPVTSAQACALAIRDMVVRGAPAIGITAAYGVVLAARQGAVGAALEDAIKHLAASRPTAVNLFWALERMQQVIAEAGADDMYQLLEQHAREIHQEDLTLNRALAEHGAALLPDQARVYTHCNTGALATGGHGTALGIIQTAWQQGKLAGVYAGETRPWMQGARLTAWELKQQNIPVTLVVDSCAGHLMANGQIQAVIVGADRIAANGDTANKIGTYGLAVLARHHGIPFIVAAPVSTIDQNLENGESIVIEQREPEEICAISGTRLAPAGVQAYNPAFDITPAALISDVVTARGVVRTHDTSLMSAHLEDSPS